jgi:hypothetical protein
LTVPPSTTVTDTIDVTSAEYDDDETTTDVSSSDEVPNLALPIIPRQNRNQNFNSEKWVSTTNFLNPDPNFQFENLQPDFAVDVSPDPFAEPLNKFGDSWIPMSFDDVMKTFSNTGVTTTTNTADDVTESSQKLKTVQQRDPKVLKWFENPYLVKQEPNFEALLKSGQKSKHNNDVTDDVMIGPTGFHTGVKTLATLAYATEMMGETDTDFWTSTEAGFDNKIDDFSRPEHTLEVIPSLRLMEQHPLTTAEIPGSNPLQKSLQNAVQNGEIFRNSLQKPLQNGEIGLKSGENDNFHLGKYNRFENEAGFFRFENDEISENPLKSGEPGNPLQKSLQNAVQNGEIFRNSLKKPLLNGEIGLKSGENDNFHRGKYIRFENEESISENPLQKSLQNALQNGQILNSAAVQNPLSNGEKGLKSGLTEKNQETGFTTGSTTTTEDPLFNWIWTDVTSSDDYQDYYDFHADDLRDPDMSDVITESIQNKPVTTGIASSDIFKDSTTTTTKAFFHDDPDEEKYSYPTLEPGFDLLSDDWFRENSEKLDETQNWHQPEVVDLVGEHTPTSTTRRSRTDNSVNAIINNDVNKNNFERSLEKYVLYYPISGTPFFSFHPKLEIASIVKR